MKALALCGLKGAATTHPEYVTDAEERPCAGTCGRTIVVAPSTLAIPGVVTMCNDCGRGAAAASVAAGLVPDLRIPPGALRRDTPEDRRRRNELEAHGFRDLPPEEVERLGD